MWTSTASTSDTMTFTCSGTDTGSTWFSYVDLTWQPYSYEKYFPAYHLLKSYGITKTLNHRFGLVSEFLVQLKECFGRGAAFVSRYQRPQPY